MFFHFDMHIENTFAAQVCLMVCFCFCFLKKGNNQQEHGCGGYDLPCGKKLILLTDYTFYLYLSLPVQECFISCMFLSIVYRETLLIFR